MKILQVLEHSKPSLTGYTIRSDYIIQNLLENNHQIAVVTSPFQRTASRDIRDNCENIDNIKYYRSYRDLTKSDSDIKKIASWFAAFMNYKKMIKNCCAIEQPQIIHSHTSYFNGFAALSSSRLFSIPLLYEIRGFRADSEVINEGLDPTSWKYKLTNYLEIRTALKANNVVAISEGIKQELVANGIRGEKIFVVPNGVDTRKFSPTAKSERIIKKYSLRNCKVLGFIGTIRKIEGLRLVVEILSEIISQIPGLKLLLVGGGDEIDALKQLAKKYFLEKHIVFTGRVPHEEVLEYYSVMDILLYPRVNAKVNHMVTALKPLEALSLEKAVLASDVGGMQELVVKDRTGLLFECDNKKDLLDKCLTLLRNDELRLSLGKDARKWIKENRDWSIIIQKYNRIYQQCITT